MNAGWLVMNCRYWVVGGGCCWVLGVAGYHWVKLNIVGCWMFDVGCG